MDIPEILGIKLIELAVEKSVGSLSRLFKTKDKKLLPSTEKLRDGLTIYIKKCLRFSENISLYKSADTLDLEENSIQLAIRNQDRRFYSVEAEKTFDEFDLLKQKNHQILLGDPGAGKTTTLKRLVSKTFQLLFSDDSKWFDYSFPIVVRLSEVSVGETLVTHIAHQLGIEYETEKKEVNETVISNDIEKERTKIVYEYKLGKYPLKYAMGEHLNQINTILFLDGLDEVNYLIRDEIFNEIKELSNSLTESKIILTSRYLQEIPSFKRFSVNEIVPLTPEQKKELAELWLDNADSFFVKLGRLPYQDIADRPLFLTYLLRLFKANNDELPEQAIDVYRQIVLLAIREWDEDKENEIRRYSKYKKFNSYKKEDFLSAIAFELTYSENVKKIFNHDQLRNAYVRVQGKYPDLNLEDRNAIIRDIESHNGLIIETSNEHFEFSHLSLQEYLCAKYILSIPISRNHHKLLNIYPAPFAIANVLTPEPENWFATLFLGNIGETKYAYVISTEALFEYLDRLLIEKIVFPKPTLELGLAVLSLFFTFDHTKVQPKLVQFSKTRFIYESIQLSLSFYNVTKHKNHYAFARRKATPTDCFLTGVEKGTISVASIHNLVQKR